MTIGRRVQMGRGRRAGFIVSSPATYATLQEYIDNATAGDTINVTGRIFSDPATVTKRLSIVGGTLSVAANTGAIKIAASSVTIDGMSIYGAQNLNLVSAERGIRVSTPAVSYVTIKNCTIANFGFAGIWLDRVTYGLQIDHNDIDDIFYAGIMVCSGSVAVIESNDISSIGRGWVDGGSGGGFDANNSYGIALTAANSPTIMTHATTVRNNVIADVPVWHALDTHGGIDIVFSANTVRTTSRPIFITSSGSSSATRVTVTQNRIESPSPVSYNLTGITMYSTIDCSVTSNAISSAYPDQGQYVPAGDDRVYDYLTLSTGLTVSDNSLI